MIKQMDMVLISILMEQNMLVNGKMINRMEKEFNNGLMDNIIKVNIKMAQNQDKGF